MELTTNNLFWVVTPLAISISLFYVYARYKLSYWSRRGVKSPPTNLIFGNFKDVIFLRKQPKKLMQEIYDFDLDEPYIGFYIFHKPMLLLRNHDLIKSVMITNFDSFYNRRFGSTKGKDLLGIENLLAINSNDVWKYLRNKLTPSLTGQKLKKMIPFIIECGEPLLNHINTIPVNENNWSSEQDSLELSSYYINDVLTNLVFGIKVNSFNDCNNGFLQYGLKVFRSTLSGIAFLIYFFIPNMTFLIDLVAFKGIKKFFYDRFKESVAYKMTMNGKREDITDFLLMLKNGEQNSIFKFNDDTIFGQALSFQVAGFESTGTATAYAIYDLACNPEYQDKLYDEIREHLSEKKLSIDVINNMSFLDSLVNESLRLHPPLPVLDRIAIKDFEVPNTGLIIEKNTSIYVSVNSTNQDPKYFSNPLEFNPYRIKDTNKKFYDSLAFGIGPRACIGQRLAILMIKIALISIISNYSLVYSNKITNYNSAFLFSYASDGLNVRFKKREKYIDCTFQEM